MKIKCNITVVVPDEELGGLIAAENVQIQSRVLTGMAHQQLLTNVCSSQSLESLANQIPNETVLWFVQVYQELVRSGRLSGAFNEQMQTAILPQVVVPALRSIVEQSKPELPVKHLTTVALNKGELKMNIEIRLAQAILNAQRIREDSYNHDEASKEAQKSFSNFDQCYVKSLLEASNEAAEKAGFDLRMTQPIYLLNKYCWNDIQSWAEEIIEGDN